MTETFSPSQVRTVARYITGIMQNVVKPIHLECLAQADVLNQMSRCGAETQAAIELALTAARANPQNQQKAESDYRRALENSLQQVFGYSDDADIVQEIRKNSGLVN